MERNEAAGLLEIGVEGFAILEDHYRNSRRPPRQERQPQYGNYRFQQQPYMNRRNPNSNYSVPVKEDVIDCNEAAKLYEGVLFKEAGRKKKSFFSFGFFSKAK